MQVEYATDLVFRSATTLSRFTNNSSGSRC